MNKTSKHALARADRAVTAMQRGKLRKAERILDGVLRELPEGYSDPEFPGLYYFLEGMSCTLSLLMDGAEHGAERIPAEA